MLIAGERWSGLPAASWRDMLDAAPPPPAAVQEPVAVKDLVPLPITNLSGSEKPIAWRWRDNEYQTWNFVGADPIHMDYVFVEPLYAHSNLIGVEDEIDRVVQSVNEWDDRTSPDDYPEHLLITSEELADILRNFASALSPSQSDPAPEIAVQSTEWEPVGNQEWCQPGDITTRQFLVTFDDPDCRNAVFDDETEARRFWGKASLNWNCYLFGALPRSEAAPEIAALQKAFDERTDKLLELVEENGLLKGKAATTEQAMNSYVREIAALRKECDEWKREAEENSVEISRLERDIAKSDEEFKALEHTNNRLQAALQKIADTNQIREFMGDDASDGYGNKGWVVRDGQYALIARAAVAPQQEEAKP